VYFPLDVFEQLSRACSEIFVLVDIVAVGVSVLFKTVHVELSDEGGEVAVFPVGRQDFFREFCDAFDDEGIGGAGPADDVLGRWVLIRGWGTSIIWMSFFTKMGTYIPFFFFVLLRLI
jgi:hypothetical protein